MSQRKGHLEMFPFMCRCLPSFRLGPVCVWILFNSRLYYALIAKNKPNQSRSQIKGQRFHPSLLASSHVAAQHEWTSIDSCEEQIAPAQRSKILSSPHSPLPSFIGRKLLGLHYTTYRSHHGRHLWSYMSPASLGGDWHCRKSTQTSERTT